MSSSSLTLRPIVFFTRAAFVVLRTLPQIDLGTTPSLFSQRARSAEGGTDTAAALACCGFSCAAQ